MGSVDKGGMLVGGIVNKRGRGWERETDLLDGYDGQLNRDFQFRMGDVSFLVSEAHGSDEAFVFDRATGEVWTDCFKSVSVFRQL